MRKRPVRILALAVFVVCLSAIIALVIRDYQSAKSFSKAHVAFTDSSFLQGAWPKSCTYDLDNTPNIVVMARVRERGGKTSVDCWWNRRVSNVSGGVLSVDDGRTDMDPRWAGCGKNSEFDQLLSDTVFEKNELIPLLTRPARGDGTYYVLASKCRKGNPHCACRNITGDYTSVAYALLDEQTGKVHW
jgi:hypothetical protein